MRRLFLIMTVFIFTGLMSAQDTPKDFEKSNSFSFSTSALMSSGYIWRGLNCGGPSLQLDATVDYKGLFLNMWWNIGVTDWTFSTFQPEVDFSIGYSRWGLSVYYIHMYFFDHYEDGSMSRFFDFHNRTKGGTTGEWRVSYHYPFESFGGDVCLLAAVRTFGRDGYIDASGQLKRAYSSYLELGYNQQLGENWELQTRVGVTPAKSIYTGYQGDFAVMLVGMKLQKTWSLGCGKMNAYAHLMLQPWQVNAHNLILPIDQASGQKLNLAVGLGWRL